MKKPASKKFFHKKPAQKSNKNEKYKFPVLIKTKEKKDQSKKQIMQGENKWPLYVYVFAICFICGIVLMGMLLVERSIAQNYNQLQTAKAARASIEKQVIQWKTIIQKYSDYRDGYYHLAILEYELGNKMDAQKYNKQALIIDPNFILARELENKLNN